jgi:MFS transporter, DHA1 family, multidrug resistance protein
MRRFLHTPPLNKAARPNFVLLVAVTVTGTLAMHIFVPALPAAARDLGASPASMQLTVTLYLVGLGLGQLIYGPLSDRFGRRPTIVISLAIYALGLGLAIPVRGVGSRPGCCNHSAPVARWCWGAPWFATARRAVMWCGACRF